MSHVFMSYSHLDENEFIAELETLLEKTGLVAWTDRDLKAGDNWRKEIDEAIRTAFALIVIMTPQAKASEFVTYEWSYGMGLGIPILPILLRPTPLHPKLEELQHVDFTEDITEPLAKLIPRLEELERSYLLRALRHKKHAVRLQAVKRLGELKYAEATPELIRLLERDHTKTLPLAVIAALTAIGTEEALKAVEKWRNKS